LAYRRGKVNIFLLERSYIVVEKKLVWLHTLSLSGKMFTKFA